MNDYKSNSHKAKAESKTEASKKDVKKVKVSGVSTVKKGGLRKLTSMLISDDIGDVKSYIISDVIIPTSKELISEIVHRLMYGDSKSSSRRGPVSYNKVSSGNSRTVTVGNRTGFEYDDLKFTTMGEAQEVRDSMIDIIESFGVVSVADMYDIVDMSAPFTSNKYGWTNLSTSAVIRSNGGYVIKLPRPMAID